MGPAFVILFWLFVGGVFIAIYVALLTAFIAGWKKHWWVVKWFCGGILTVMTFFGCLVPCLLIYGLVRSSVPRFVFADALGMSPSSRIHDLRSQVYWFADTGSIYLQFETDHDAFVSVVPKDLPRVTYAAFQTQGEANWEPPKGWQEMKLTPPSEIYFHASAYGQGKNFATEMAMMVYDPEKHMAYYHFLGID